MQQESGFLPSLQQGFTWREPPAISIQRELPLGICLVARGHCGSSYVCPQVSGLQAVGILRCSTRPLLTAQVLPSVGLVQPVQGQLRVTQRGHSENTGCIDGCFYTRRLGLNCKIHLLDLCVSPKHWGPICLSSGKCAAETLANFQSGHPE